MWPYVCAIPIWHLRQTAAPLPLGMAVPLPLGIAEVNISCQTTLTTKIDAVQLDIGLIQQDLNKMRVCLTAVEQRVGHLKDIVVEHSTSLHTLQTKMLAMEYWAEDAENWNRRNNLRIVGLAEGKNPSESEEGLLQSFLLLA